ncbi:MAG: MerR family transcriptional regulator [Chloroflexi bacterium]|nr:MerR family transcriptional regulator [Chloroflexota bacterium]
MQTQKYRIKDLSDETGVPVSTINHYINMGILKERWREDNNYRLFGHQELDRLARITDLRTQGFSLEQIRRMLSEEGGEK